MHVRGICWPAFKVYTYSGTLTVTQACCCIGHLTGGPSCLLSSALHVLILINHMCGHAFLQYAQQAYHVTACDYLSSEAAISTCMDRVIT